MSAESAAEALGLMRARAVAGDPFDLAIVDVEMPDVDGLHLAGRIRSEPGLASSAAVLLASTAEHRAAVRGTGFTQLTKPVRPSRLHDALIEALETSGPDTPDRT